MDARTRSYLARAAEAVAEGRFDEAAGYERMAADRVHDLGDPPEETAALLDAGARRQYARGDAARAAETLTTLIEFRRRLGDRHGEVEALHRLALAQQVLGREKAAQEAFGAARTVIHKATAAPPDPPPAASPEEELEAVLDELDGLVGLAEVKTRIRELIAFQRVQDVRDEAGLKTVAVSQHLAFTGSPGTGKTTVGRLYGRLLHAIGVMKTSTLVETSRAQLVAGYIGQTATKVDSVVDSALDGVLFVDEAYALTESGSSEDFGAEAVAQLLTRMETDRERLVVIFAGYSAPMKRFLESNPGLESRVSEVIEFPDYSPAELFQIFDVFCGRADYELAPEAATRLRTLLEEMHGRRDESFGNARTVRNLFEDAIVAQATRLVDAAASDKDRLRRLEPADVDAAFGSAAAT